MLFNSYTFFLFLMIVLVLYYSVRTWSLRKLIVIAASYIFYAAWNPPFVIFLVFTSVVDYIAAKRIFLSKEKSSKKVWILISLVSNLGLLSFFKYGNFFIENFNFLFPVHAIDQYSIVLPVGISFYTFQTLSYTLDIYRGKINPSNNLIDYLLYVTFFPQLVAGPIMRADKFLIQCEEEKPFQWDNLGYGLFWVIIGLFLKVVLADHLLAPVVESVYATNGNVSTVSAWVGTLSFSGQILCDFAGYSICAIGAAEMLGFRLIKNFKFPYASMGFSEFWRRWHISLSTWLRDYLYIPLGGNQKGEYRTYQNLMTTMLIGGLWHGASWTFVVWGGLHGLYLSLERMLKPKVNFDKIPRLIRILGVFVLVCFTWIFFRANTFEQAGNILMAMLGVANGASVVGKQQALLVFGVIGLILIVNYVFRDWDLEEKVKQLQWWKVSVILALFLYLIFTLAGEDRSFIYFQF